MEEKCHNNDIFFVIIFNIHKSKLRNEGGNMQILYSFNNEKELKIIRAIMKGLYGKDNMQRLEGNDESVLSNNRRYEDSKVGSVKA
jgi:hypothetical protein